MWCFGQKYVVRKHAYYSAAIAKKGFNAIAAYSYVCYGYKYKKKLVIGALTNICCIVTGEVKSKDRNFAEGFRSHCKGT